MTLKNIGNLFRRFNTSAYLLPLVALCFVFTYSAISGLVHDYSNNYFPALLITEGVAPESVVFNIFDFNQYIWNKGYTNELTDFYLNSPFIATLFYPLALIKNAYYSKVVFNLISCSFLIFALYIFSKNYLAKSEQTFLLLLPLLFFVPLRNNIEFGQLYLLIVSFTLLGYHYVLAKNKLVGELLLSVSIFIKVFPVVYCIPLLYNKRWKSLFTIFFLSLFLFSISILVGGWSFWSTYLFDVLPNSILNGSTVDFRTNSQSIEVFLKTLFVRDVYYNPEALFDNVKAFKLISIFIKSLVLAIAISLSFKHKKHLFRLLSIWVVALFLIQPRTATYAQILWLIPAIEVLKSTLSRNWKVVFFCFLFLVCNFPFHWLREGSIFIVFSRLWLSIALAVISFSCFKFRFSISFSKVFVVVFAPLLLLTLFKKEEMINSEYVLQHNTSFMIHDFNVENGSLIYQALGKNGDEKILTNIEVKSFERNSCSISNHQVFYKNTQLTNTHAIKKRPVLVNGCEVYFLTDHHSRRGAFTLKKINVCL